MDTDEIIREINAEIQAIEDTKTNLTEQQEGLREVICMLRMMEVPKDG